MEYYSASRLLMGARNWNEYDVIMQDYFINLMNNLLELNTYTSPEFWSSAFYIASQRYADNNNENNTYKVFIDLISGKVSTKTNNMEFIYNSLLIKNYDKFKAVAMHCTEELPPFMKTSTRTIKFDTAKTGEDKTTPNGDVVNFSIDEDVPLNTSNTAILNPSFKKQNTISDKRVITNSYDNKVARNGTETLSYMDTSYMDIYKFMTTKYMSVVNCIDRYIIQPLIVEVNEVI